MFSVTFALAAAAAAALAPAVVNAQLSGLRGTIPGSLHQCENTNMFFFDSSNSRPLTVLFLDPANIPASARSGTVQLSDAAGYSPLQVIQGINSPDAQEYDFQLQIEQGQAFEVFAFLEDGTGKALSLTRTVTTPLPAATSCLGNVQTTVSGVNAAPATTSSSSSSSSRSTSSSSSSRVSGAGATSTTAGTTRSTSGSTRSTSTTQATVTATPTGLTGTADAASLSSIPAPTGAATSNMVISSLFGLVASLVALALI